MDSVQPLVVSAHLFALLLVLVASVMSVPLPVQNTSANGTNNSTALLHDQSVIALYPTCLTSSVVMTTTAASSALAPLATIHSGSSTINSTSCAFLAQQPSGFGITAQATSLAPRPGAQADDCGLPICYGDPHAGFDTSAREQHRTTQCRDIDPRCCHPLH
ncbi:hypothetical protein MVEN_00438000 [Mycena venus]|uniref:Hydrophobin n=1 Tax=Mycena venus TaxID=2733690 RepID=A0A8H6YVV7_9AGAR|nr:hypothetical protein MVEN_00438000 [Mycena venus]